MPESFEAMLTGGHPNSLGRTVEVVAMVLADPSRLEALFACYQSADAVVRLRTSNAFKRVWREDAALVVPYIDRFLHEIADLDQPSAQWTLAQLALELDAHLTDAQRSRATQVLKRNLTQYDDWIVLNNSLEALGKWAKHDATLRDWLRPHVERLAGDSRKSVAKKAARIRDGLYAG